MVSMSKQKQLLGLIGWLFLSFAASAVGAAASIQAQSFYGQLVQPAWAPPPWVFGPVWTVLFALMAGSPAGRRAPRPLPAVGQLRSSPQLCPVAAQPPDPGLARS